MERNARGVIQGNGPFQPPAPTELAQAQERIQALEAALAAISDYINAIV